MDAETATLPELAAEYSAAVTESARFAFLVRDTDLQLEQIKKLSVLKDRLKRFKYGAISAKDEAASNLFFHLQCGLNAMISFLRMWVFLKEPDYYAAWDRLIDAQEYISLAMRAADGGVGLENFLARLKRAEDVIFPGYSVYNSWGVIICGGRCSIRDRPFGDCEHIEGLIYWGRLCVRVGPEFVEMDHVAIVDEPRDRKCVITEITGDDGYYLDYMTLKRTKPAESKADGEAGRLTAKIFCNGMLEID